MDKAAGAQPVSSGATSAALQAQFPSRAVLRSAYRSPGVAPERQPVVADETAVLGLPAVPPIIGSRGAPVKEPRAACHAQLYNLSDPRRPAHPRRTPCEQSF